MYKVTFRKVLRCGGGHIVSPRRSGCLFYQKKRYNVKEWLYLGRVDIMSNYRECEEGIYNHFKSNQKLRLKLFFVTLLFSFKDTCYV